MDAKPEFQLQKMVLSLLRHYSFDTVGQSLSLVVATWISTYPPQWILNAIIEALYQGRYKTVSVEQILIIWLRRGQPIPHFSYEFERIVCDRVLDMPNAHFYHRAELPGATPAIQPTVTVDHNDPQNGDPRKADITDATGVDSIISIPIKVSAQSISGDSNSTANYKSLEPLSTDSVTTICGASTQPIQPISVTDIASYSPTQGTRLSAHPKPNQDGAVPKDRGQERGLAIVWSRSRREVIAQSQPFQSTHPAHKQYFTPNQFSHLHPIHQFQPTKASVTIHNKLKAIAQTSDSPN